MCTEGYFGNLRLWSVKELVSKFPYVLSGRNLMYQEMDQNVILLLPVLIPIAAGILLLTVKRLRSSRKAMLCLVVAALTA